MKIELKKWSIEDKESLIRICNTIDRNYLSDYQIHILMNQQNGG